MEMADEKFELLDKPMATVFDWSEDNTPLRDALWNHYMDESNKNTLSTLDHLKQFEKMDNSQAKSEAEKVLHV